MDKAKDNLEKRRERFQKEKREQSQKSDSNNILRYNPSNWFHWKENIILKCKSIYGDNGKALETSEDPKYIQEEFQMPDDADMPANGTLQLEKIKLQMREHHSKVSAYIETMVLECSPLLWNIVQKNREQSSVKDPAILERYKNMKTVYF